MTAKGLLAIGSEFIDADLRRWVVRAMPVIRNAHPWFLRPLTYLASGPFYRVDHELEALEPISLEEVKRRIRAWMQANSPEWSPDDDLDEVISANVADLEAATSITEIYERFQPDTFESI